MSKSTLAELITKELEMVNDRIDRRIIAGRSYKKLSRHHRHLLSQLGHISRRNVYNHAYGNF